MAADLAKIDLSQNSLLHTDLGASDEISDSSLSITDRLYMIFTDQSAVHRLTSPNKKRRSHSSFLLLSCVDCDLQTVETAQNNVAESRNISFSRCIMAARNLLQTVQRVRADAAPNSKLCLPA